MTAKHTNTGQASVEFIVSAAAILLVFVAVANMHLSMQRDMAFENRLLSATIGCTTIADTINAVYSDGPGTMTDARVKFELTVMPGLVEMSPPDDAYTCTIDPNAVSGQVLLSPGEYTVYNRGGKVEFKAK